MSKTLQQVVIEMIATQAIFHARTNRWAQWSNFDPKPVIDSMWFWDNFRDMVYKAETNLRGAIESWVTVEFEEAIVERIKSQARPPVTDDADEKNLYQITINGCAHYYVTCTHEAIRKWDDTLCMDGVEGRVQVTKMNLSDFDEISHNHFC